MAEHREASNENFDPNIIAISLVFIMPKPRTSRAKIVAILRD